MKLSRKQKKPLASDTYFDEQDMHSKEVTSFKKVIFQTIPEYKDSISIKPKDRIKLFRFRNGVVNQDKLPYFRSPQSLKSLQSVRDIELHEPRRKSDVLKKGVSHLSLLLTKLTRCSTIQINLVAYGDLENPKAQFSNLWSGIFKELKNYDPKKLKIRIRAQWNPNRFYPKGLNWQKSTFQLLKYMKNLYSLDVNISVTAMSQFRDFTVWRKSNRIKHLSKLKEIVIGGVEHITNNYVTVYEHFWKPPTIVKVGIGINKSNFIPLSHFDYEILQYFWESPLRKKLVPKPNSQLIAKSLDKLHQLKHLVFQGKLEILDLISVIHTHPGLNTINIVDSWSYDNQKVPIDTLTLDLQVHNITQLFLDLNLPIKSKEDCHFYRKLMGAFVNLEYLRIGFDTTKIIDLVSSCADILVSLKKITRLELALSITPENMETFFTQMQSITTLKHFSFVLNIQIPRNVRKQIPQAIQPLQKFLSSQNNLEIFELHCHDLGFFLFQELCKLILGLQKLQSIALSIDTNDDKYQPLHDKMFKEIQNTAETITNTQELYVTMINGGPWRMKIPKELVEWQSNNLKKFKFAIGNRWEVPPYAKRWFGGMKN